MYDHPIIIEWLARERHKEFLAWTQEERLIRKTRSVEGNLLRDLTRRIAGLFVSKATPLKTNACACCCPAD